MKTLVCANNAPRVVGPYSHAVVVGDTVYCSGQIGLHPHTNEFVPGGVVEQARQALTNLAAVLEAAGSSMEDVVSMTLYLTSMDDYVAVNEVYASFFTTDPRPARATVAVSQLPKSALCEVACVAVRSSSR